MPKEKINKNTVLADILEVNGSSEVLSKHKVPCLHCPMAQMEMQSLKLGDICSMYGIDFDKILEDLNKL